MDISVKFVDFGNNDVISTSCAYNSLVSCSTVKYVGPDTINGNGYYYFGLANEEVSQYCQYFYLHDTKGNQIGDYSYSAEDVGLVEGQKYHLVINGWELHFYICNDPTHQLSTENPFEE